MTYMHIFHYNAIFTFECTVYSVHTLFSLTFCNVMCLLLHIDSIMRAAQVEQFLKINRETLPRRCWSDQTSATSQTPPLPEAKKAVATYFAKTTASVLQH